MGGGREFSPLGQRMFDRVLKILLFLTPIAYTVGMPLEKFDLVIFQLAMVALFISSLWSKPQRYLDFKPLSIILILCGFNLAVSQFNNIVLSNFLFLFFGIVIIYLISIYCSDIEGTFKFIMWAGLINIIVLGFQKISFSPIIENSLGEPGGILGNAPRLCIYLALTLPFAAQINFWLIFLYMIVGAICGEYLLTLFGFVTLFSFGYNHDVKIFYKKYGIIILILVFIGVFFVRGHIVQSLNIRWIAWKPIIEQIFQRPFLGFGFGMLPHVANQFMNLRISGDIYYKIDNCLSSYLYFVFGVGLLGTIWLGYVFKFVKERFMVHKAQSFSVLFLLILCIVEYPFEISKIWFTICAIIAFFIIDNKKERLNHAHDEG